MQEFGDEISLSTFSGSNIETSTEEPPVSNFTAAADVVCHLDGFGSVSVNYQFVCICSNKIKATRELLIKCESCKTTTRLSKMKQLVSILVKADGLPDESSLYYLNVHDVERVLLSPITMETDSDEIVKSIMALDNITVCVKNSKEVNIQFEEDA